MAKARTNDDGAYCWPRHGNCGYNETAGKKLPHTQKLYCSIVSSGQSKVRLSCPYYSKRHAKRSNVMSNLAQSSLVGRVSFLTFEVSPSEQIK